MTTISDQLIGSDGGDFAMAPAEEQSHHGRRHHHHRMSQDESGGNYGPEGIVEPQESHDHRKREATLPMPPRVHLDVQDSRLPSTPLNRERSGRVKLTPLEIDETPLLSPPRRQRMRPSLLRRLWLCWLTAYRILIGFTFIANFAVLIWYVSKHLPVGPTLTASAINFLIAILVRQEDLINASYFVLAKTPSSLPLGYRKLVSDFHHYGGLHIGCACAALMWYCLLAVVSTIQCVCQINDGKLTPLILTDTIVIWAFLLTILVVCITAHPKLRVRFHNTFEHTHRFGGWLATAVLWVHTGVSTLSPNSKPLYENANLWILTSITLLLILPWLRIRRVPITASLVSRREVKISFPYSNMPYMSTTRFSRHPMLDWHAFATVPNAASAGTEVSIIVSQAGDWTTSVLETPPSHLWLRKPATRNFLALTPLFNSVLLVATGAGIGPMLSLLSSPIMSKMREQGKIVRVIWCVYEPNAPHWKSVLDIIRNVDGNSIIFDSRQGRPDLAFEARYLARLYNIEAVMVVSNKKVTNEVVREVKAYGGAAYGAVFDS